VLIFCCLIALLSMRSTTKYLTVDTPSINVSAVSSFVDLPSPADDVGRSLCRRSISMLSIRSINSFADDMPSIDLSAAVVVVLI
jgi:hypothetical protein